MDFFIILIVIFSILAPVGGIIFWYFVIRTVINHVAEYDREQHELKQLIKKYSKKKKKGQVPAQLDYDIMSKFGSLQNHFSQMPQYRQQQYLPKYESMVSSVTNAGFTNFDPNY